MRGSPGGTPERIPRAPVKQGRSSNAIDACRETLRKNPRDVGTMCELAELQIQSADYGDAKRVLLKAKEIRPREEAVLILLSAACTSEGRMDQALEYADQALAAHPKSPESARVKAEAMRTIGDYEGACELLRPFAEKPGAPVMTVLSFARLCRRFDGIDRSIELARGALERAGGDRAQASQAGFVLGELLDAAGRYDEAFGVFREANDLLRSPGYSVEKTVERFEAMTDAWTGEAAVEAPTSGAKTDFPVFVVGMPRSGTTLVERIIGAHPKAFAGGERPEITEASRHVRDTRGNFMTDPSVLHRQDLAKRARLIDRKFRSLAPKGTERFVDKLPTNYLRLHLIKGMFPNATFIHTLRDPRDTCLSCYFHSFTGAYPYSHDLADLGAYYRAYERYTSHFVEVLGLDVLDVRYEDVVSDQEGWSRRLIDHVGLEWHEDCLSFHKRSGTSVTASNEQVRRPIYSTSVGRWKNYEEHLGPLLDALGDLV
ncbi:MAG: sulfotransferase [Phycisphaerales bacterium]